MHRPSSCNAQKDACDKIMETEQSLSTQGSRVGGLCPQSPDIGQSFTVSPAAFVCTRFDIHQHRFASHTVRQKQLDPPTYPLFYSYRQYGPPSLHQSNSNLTSVLQGLPRHSPTTNLTAKSSPHCPFFFSLSESSRVQALPSR
jgi:hypothetical protein